MVAALLVVVPVTIVAMLAIVIADLLRAKFVLANSAEVGVDAAWLPLLAALKGAGAIGLLVGLFGFRAIGIAGAAGLVMFFVGAVALHVRKRVFHNMMFPVTYLLLSLGSMWLLAID
jgi:hypothetical protein